MNSTANKSDARVDDGDTFPIAGISRLYLARAFVDCVVPTLTFSRRRFSNRATFTLSYIWYTESRTSAIHIVSHFINYIAVVNFKIIWLMISINSRYTELTREATQRRARCILSDDEGTGDRTQVARLRW